MKDVAIAQRGWASLSNLTENQLLFWMGYKLQRTVPVETHSIRFVFRIEDEIDKEHFRCAFQKLVDQADSLRTAFREVDLVPRRDVAERLSVEVNYVRYADDPYPEVAFRRWLDQKRQTALPSETPFECSLLQIGPKHFAWYLALHHLISDARTVQLVAQHVSQYYQLSLDGQLESAAPLPAFEDYVSYDRAHRSSEAYRRTGAHWSNKLAGLRIRRSNQASREFGNAADSSVEKLRTGFVSVGVDREQSEAVRALVRREVLISPAVIFLTVLFLVLARLNGCARPLTVGTPFLNRPEPFLDTIGLFVSTCPLVVEVDPDDTLLSLARKVQTEFVRASAHQNYPIQNPVHGRIYETFFNYLNVQFAGFAGRAMRTERIRSGFSNNSFNVAVRDFDRSGEFTVDFELRRQEFPPERQQEIATDFIQLIELFAREPHRVIGPFL